MSEIQSISYISRRFFMNKNTKELQLLDVEIVGSDNYENDIKEIIKQSQLTAYRAVNVLLVKRNWLIGKRIYEEVLKGDNRAEYGTMIIAKLSKTLTKEFGSGFNKINLYFFYTFYKMYRNIFYAPRKQFSLLSWTHYRILITVLDPKAREWYENECTNQQWSYRTLKRNIESQYYYRLLKTQSLDNPIKQIGTPNDEKYEFIKNPMIFEFLDVPQNAEIHESELETALISNLKDVLVELGKGFAYAGRQFHIHTEKDDYFIGLVFYNYILKCFVLIDLKTRKITHQDVGQMDMYVRMFDELKKDSSDNPTLGIILCSETDEDIAKYSILKGSEQLFASKYKLYLPTEEELKAEIERQKELFYAAQIEEKV